MCPAAAVALAFALSFDPVKTDEADFVRATLYRFPSKQTAEKFAELIYRHQDWIDFMVACRPDNEAYRDWNSDCLRCGNCWYYLSVAREPGVSLEVQLMALEELRTRLGNEAFIRGRMPPPVPLWRFCEGSPPLGTPPPPSRRNQTGVISCPPPP